MVYCTDVLTLDAPKRTRDGYMAVRAKAARTGVYDYAGSEVDPENKHGLRDTPIVKVLRDDQTVFDNTSARSFIGKPITDDHPAEPVTSKNWKDLARGTVMGAMRDGEYLTFDLLLTDAEAIAKVDAGKRELSNGYSTDLQFGDFTAPDGTKCQARQTSIVGNHVALVDRGRAGSNCAIKDRFAACDALPADLLDRLTSIGDTPMKTLTIDGLKVPNVSDEAEAAIVKLQADKAAAERALSDATTAHDKALAAKDSEIDELKAKVVDQAAIDKLADAKAQVVTRAKELLGDKAPDFAGKTVADVRRETVRIIKGDEAVADKSDDYVEARFDGLTDGKPTTVQSITAPRTTTNDNASVRDFVRSAQFA